MRALNRTLGASIAGTLLALAGCAHGSSANAKDGSVVASGDDSIVSLWSGPVKDHGARFDVSFNIKNMSTAQSISIPASELSCRRGTTRGELKSAGKAKLETSVYLKPGLTRTFSLSCVMASKPSGDYTIEIGKVFAANPNGSPTVNIIAKNLSWHYVDAASPY